MMCELHRAPQTDAFRKVRMRTALGQIRHSGADEGDIGVGKADRSMAIGKIEKTNLARRSHFWATCRPEDPVAPNPQCARKRPPDQTVDADNDRAHRSYPDLNTAR